MHNLKPAEAIEMFRIIAALDWQALNENDRATFADAGPDARIAWISQTRSSQIAELFDIRPDLEGRTPLAALIGGDHLTLEIHGVDEHGDTISLAYDLQPSEQ